MPIEGFFNKNFFIVEKLWLFGLFSGDKGDNIDYVDDQDYDQSQSNIRYEWFCLFQK